MIGEFYYLIKGGVVFITLIFSSSFLSLINETAFGVVLVLYFPHPMVSYTPICRRWTGELNGNKGLFPASYVKIL